MKVNICVQIHKRINGRSPGYISNLLVLNSDNNERNNRNSSLNSVFPRLRREIEVGGGGGRTFGHGEGNKIVECSPKFFKGD